MLRKIISGAQTGADQAGLVAAEVLGLERGGTVPKGRRTNIGPLTDEQMERWNLVEHYSSEYPPRTLCNVRESDGTVIFGNVKSPGCSLTYRICNQLKKPVLQNPSPNVLSFFVTHYNIEVLNVAGNREETNPGIFDRVKELLIEAFR